MGHEICRNDENAIKAVTNWKLGGKRSRGRRRKRRSGVVLKDWKMYSDALSENCCVKDWEK